MVPYYINIGQRSLRDLVDQTQDQFLEYLSGAKELPKTANPGAGDYLKAYLSSAEHTSEIVSIHMTSLGSGGYQAALLGKEMALRTLPHVRIEVVDSRNVSMCQGWMALEAARAAQAGASLDEILALLQRMIPVARMLQTADTLRYLYMGGRIGMAQHLVGSLLRIKPIISMENGVIVALGQARSRPAVYRRIVDLIAAKVGAGAAIKAAIVHAADPEAAQELELLVRKGFECVELAVCNLSSALAVHTGPGTVGVCYFPVSVL
jgi:DegV family protein with EDD domain